jgi:hypothetical protein
MLDSLDTLIAFVLIMLVVSLLITIAVQMAAAALNLRSINLLSGLGSAFAIIAPDLEKKKEDLAHYILQGRLLSDSFLPIELPKAPRWVQKWLSFLRPTSAARPQEIFDAIHRVAVGNEYEDPNKPTESEQERVENAKQLLSALGIRIETSPDALQATKTLRDAVNAALAAVPDQSLREKAEDALAKVSSNFSKLEANAARFGATVIGDIDAAYEKFNYYTCIAQERAQQWLTMHTRILTVIFSIIAAFFFQLDTVQIFKLVSSNKAVRDKLVAQAATVSSQAEKTLNNSPSILQDAYDSWLRSADDKLKGALASAPIKITATDTREKVVGAIDDVLTKGNIDKTLKDPALKSLNETIDKTVTQNIQDEAHDYATIQSDFKDTGFQLFPDAESGRWKKGGWQHPWRGSAGHRLGIIFSIGLLSLGAPFWYTALKNLVDLRSQVAQNISKQKEQAQKQGADAAKPEAPPTLK